MSEQPKPGPFSSAPGDSPDDARAPRDQPHVRPRTEIPGSSQGLPAFSIGVGSSNGASSAPEPPKLDGYEVIAMIGEGGMGSVWRGVQLSTRRNVALKIISAAAFAMERARQRFDREVEITAKLEHPNIARVYDSGINRGVYYYAMELIDGVPLDQFISRRKLSRPDILRLFAAICRGVQYAHQRGVIHRDLKAGNILVSSDGQPHVLDFGLAKALQQAGKEAGISRDGEISGTIGYMSPEQAGGLPNLDARCDVYSLGVLLYQSLTGDSPHDLGGTYMDVLRRLTDEEPKRPRLADRTMDREMEALLLCALQRDLRQRYRNAGEMAQDIENYLNGDPISAKRPTLLYFAGKRVRKHRVKIGVISSLLILAALAALLTIRLHSSRLARTEQERATLEASQKAAENARLEKLASANGAISRGDDFFSKGNPDLARESYRKAWPLFNEARASARPADLGLWDVARTSPEPILTIPAPLAISANKTPAAKTTVTSGALIFLADNRHVLGGCEDGSLREWDAATGRIVQTISAHDGAVRSVCASADGHRALSGGAEGALKMWNLDTGAPIVTFQDPSANASVSLKRVALSGDGHFALCARGKGPLQSTSASDTLTLWDAANARLLLITDRAAGVLDVKGSVTQTIFSPDSAKVLTTGAEVVVWNTADGKRIAELPHSAMSASFSPDGNWVVAGSSNGAIRLLELSSGRVVEPAKSGSSAISAIWSNPMEDRIVIATEDGAFREVDMSGKERWSQPGGADLNAVAISPDARVALTAADDGLSVWRLSAAPEAGQLAGNGPFPEVQMSRDGRLALARRISTATNSPAAAVLFDTATGKNLTPANFPSDACNGIALSRDGRTIARVSGAILALWSLDPPHELAKFTIKPARYSSEAADVALSGDGKSVAVCTADNSVLVYQVPGITEPVKLIGHESLVTSIDFSADGHSILTGSDDRTARIWDAQSGKQLAVLRGHAAAISAVAFFDDGKTVVTASGARLFQAGDDNSVRLWDVATGKQLSTLRAPEKRKRVRSVAVSGDGRLIASSDDDQMVILCDRATGEILRTLRSPSGPVFSLSFDQTGDALLCGNATLNVWKLARPAEQRMLAGALNAARSRSVSESLTPSDLLALGRWHAFENEPAWGASFLAQAAAAGQSISALQLARCDWQRGNLVAAELEMKGVSPQEAPAFYVKLCIDAISAEKIRRTDR